MQTIKNKHKTQQKKYLKKIISNQKKMKKWAKHCPENFLTKHLLVEAELKNLKNEPLEAANLYEQSIQEAETNGFLYIQAIACELASNFWFDQGNSALGKTYLAQAYDCYSQWG